MLENTTISSSNCTEHINELSLSCLGLEIGYPNYERIDFIQILEKVKEPTAIQIS